LLCNSLAVAAKKKELIAAGLTFRPFRHILTNTPVGNSHQNEQVSFYVMAASLRSLMCPAEENASCGKLRPINARRSSEKIDTRTSSFQAAGHAFCGQKLFFVAAVYRSPS